MSSFQPIYDYVFTSGTSLTAVGGITVLILLFVSSFSSNRSSMKIQDFENGDREKIKQIKKDTRFLRFTQGRTLSEEGKELAGANPYFINNGNIRELVISKPHELQEFLHKDYKDHTKAVNMNMGDYAGRLLGQCIGQQNGKHWSAMRKHFDPEFSHAAAAALVPRFALEIENWIQNLHNDALLTPDLPEGSFIQDVVRSCKLLSFRMISVGLYGEAFNDMMFDKLIVLSRLRENLVITAISQPRTASWWYNLLPTVQKRKMDTFLAEWKKFNLGLIQSVRKRGISCPAERIFRGCDSDDEMTEVEYLQTLDEILFANIDITGSVLAFVLDNIAAQSDFQRRLRLEILGLGKGEKSVDITEYVARQDSLIHYVILESLRVTPAVNFSPAECTAIPKTISGYRIPPRTPVVIDIRRLNTDPSVWSPDPEVFRPERFAQLTPAKYRYALLRFGIGPGRCLGKNMADLLLKMVTKSVVEAFELKPPVHGQKDKGQAGFTVSIGGQVEFRRL